MPRARGSRRKQQEVLSEQPTCEEGQSVARVIRACGENKYEIEDGSGEKSLYQLPKRLRHVAFIRGGSYVFVRDDSTRGPGKVRGDIEVVVMDRFLNALRAESFWPAAFAKETPNNVGSSAGLVESPNEDSDSTEESDESWEAGGGNPNRRKWDHVESDSDSSTGD